MAGTSTERDNRNTRKRSKKNRLIILTDDDTLFRKRRSYRFAGLLELTRHIIEKCQSRTGILLPLEAQIDSEIEEFCEKVVQRTKEFDAKYADQFREAATRHIPNA